MLQKYKQMEMKLNPSNQYQKHNENKNFMSLYIQNKPNQMIQDKKGQNRDNNKNVKSSKNQRDKSDDKNKIVLPSSKSIKKESMKVKSKKAKPID